MDGNGYAYSDEESDAADARDVEEKDEEGKRKKRMVCQGPPKSLPRLEPTVSQQSHFSVSSYEYLDSDVDDDFGTRFQSCLSPFPSLFLTFLGVFMPPQPSLPHPPLSQRHKNR